MSAHKPMSITIDILLSMRHSSLVSFVEDWHVLQRDRWQKFLWTCQFSEHAANFKYVHKCPQIPLMSTKCPSERVSRTEFEDLSCRHCPTCPDIPWQDRMLVIWGGSEDMSSSGQMKLSTAKCCCQERIGPKCHIYVMSDDMSATCGQQQVQLSWMSFWSPMIVKRHSIVTVYYRPIGHLVILVAQAVIRSHFCWTRSKSLMSQFWFSRSF
jgi:hypothetical protein